MFSFKVILLIGITIAYVGPRELIKISRKLGRMTGRAVAEVQLIRGEFDTVMHQSQAHQVQKELQDTLSQLEAIRHEVRSISMLNPGPMTRRLVKDIGQVPDTDGSDGHPVTGNLPNSTDQSFANNVSNGYQKTHGDVETMGTISKECSSSSSHLNDMHRRAAAYAKLAESAKNGSLKNNMNREKLNDRSGLKVLLVSAESAGMLPNRPADIKGSDIVLEAILEADVAHHAKEYFAKPGNEIKQE